jgi:hypothetical protein
MMTATAHWLASSLRLKRFCAAKSYEFLGAFRRMAIAIFKPQIYWLSREASAADYTASFYLKKRIAMLE